jgi:hypothetical protein
MPSNARVSFLLACIASGAGGGCPDRTVAAVPPNESGVIQKTIPLGNDVDILFVVDNSHSTIDKQQLFTANFASFVKAVDGFPTGRPNLHIGVISSTVDQGAQAGQLSTACHTTPNDDGRLHGEVGSGCAPLDGAFISDILGSDGVTRVTNYGASGSQGATEAALENEFGCIANLGDTGCGFEAPLEAIHRALDNTHVENAGFLRPGAFLAIVILTDEDDCSVGDPSLFSLDAKQLGSGANFDFRCQPMFAYSCDQPITSAPATYTNCRVRTDSYLQDPATYATFLGSVKNSSDIVVALVAGGDGNGNPVVAPATISTGDVKIQDDHSAPIDQNPALMASCSTPIGSDTAIARPAIRLMDFVQQFGDHGLFESVCQQDYSAALTSIGDLLGAELSPCLDGAVNATDTDPSNPGVQPACTVEYVTSSGSGASTSQAIPTCPMAMPGMPAATAPTPCWYVTKNPSCTTTSGLAVTITGDQPPAGTVEQVACVAQ